MVVLEIWISILAYIKNWLVFWSDDKELSSETEVIGWNFLKKHIMCVCVSELFVVLCTHDTYCIESWLTGLSLDQLKSIISRARF